MAKSGRLYYRRWEPAPVSSCQLTLNIRPISLHHVYVPCIYTIPLTVPGVVDRDGLVSRQALDHLPCPASQPAMWSHHEKRQTYLTEGLHTPLFITVTGWMRLRFGREHPTSSCPSLSHHIKETNRSGTQRLKFEKQQASPDQNTSKITSNYSRPPSY